MVDELVSLTFPIPSRLKMGAPIFALTDTVETAADLAARSGGKQELVQLLRAVEGKEVVVIDPVMQLVLVLAHHARNDCVTSQRCTGISLRDVTVDIFQI